jgi:hypothetical protein
MLVSRYYSTVIHGGTLWLDPLVSIDTTLIACITGLRKAGEDPSLLFHKMGERALSEAMKEKFDTFRGKRGLDVKRINDKEVRFTTQVLAYKLLHKCRRDEVPTTVISEAEKCKEGVQMNWVTFLVNQFLQDCTEAQEKGAEFHYAWLLILIALVRWQEPAYFQRMHSLGRSPLAARYANLWHTTIKR